MIRPWLGDAANPRASVKVKRCMNRADDTTTYEMHTITSSGRTIENMYDYVLETLYELYLSLRFKHSNTDLNLAVPEGRNVGNPGLQPGVKRATHEPGRPHDDL
jgi:hypothetical protein